MADIGEFARQAAQRINASQKVLETFGERFNLALSQPVVEDFIKAAFYASMIPDEGRYPTVCLMCYRRDSVREINFSFSTPREPTASEIAKLAHAVASGSHLCVLSHEGKLLLGGIHITVLDQLRPFGFRSFRTGNPLKLLIRGPGHIEVSNGGTALIYRAGDILEESPFLFGHVMKALAESVASELENPTDGSIESLENIFNDLAEAIVHLGHGGLLLAAKHSDLEQFSSARPLACSLLRQLLMRYWSDVATLEAATSGVANRLVEQHQQAAGPHSLTVASSTTMLENCIRSIAHLAGMDGAIVMDYACNVVAFNAIISTDGEGTGQGRLVDRSGREIPEAVIAGNRGSRHQSAVFYARRVPHSFVFVISQDGVVSAFHNRGDGTVLCERGLRVLD